MPDANWPNLPNYRTFTEADHAAHRSPKGIAYPADLFPGGDTKKLAKSLFKVARKPHIKLKTTRAKSRRKKHK